MLPNVTSVARAQFDRQTPKYNERWARRSDETLQHMLEMVAAIAGHLVDVREVAR